MQDEVPNFVGNHETGVFFLLKCHFPNPALNTHFLSYKIDPRFRFVVVVLNDLEFDNFALLRKIGKYVVEQESDNVETVRGCPIGVGGPPKGRQVCYIFPIPPGDFEVIADCHP